MTDARIHDLAVESRRVLDIARYQTRATDPDQAWNDVGAIADYLTEIAALAYAPSPSPPPVPVQRLVQPGHSGVLRIPGSGLTVTVRCPTKASACPIAFTLNGGALQSDEPVPQMVDADLVRLGFVEVEALYDYSSMAGAYASVLAALQWAYANAAALGGDPARVHGVGHSTGGSLIALLGLRSDSPGFSGAMFLWSAAATTGHPLGAGPETIMVTSKYGAPPDQWFPANWLSDAKSRGAHVQVRQIHASDDSLVPYTEAAEFAQRGQYLFAEGWQFHSTTGGHGATAAPLCSQSQQDLVAVDRS